MNGLSWLLYLADVSQSVGWSFGLGLIVCVVAVAVGVFAFLLSLNDDFKPDEGKSFRQFSGHVLRVFIPASLVLFLASALIPSRNTLMLIAASQVGEQVLATDTAKQIGGEAGELATDSLKLLRKYITEQLGETKAE